MRKIILLQFFFMFLLCVSCNEKVILEETYYENGSVKAVMYQTDSLNIVEKYDSLGSLDLKIFIKNGRSDSLVKFNKDGTLKFRKKMLQNGATYSVEYDDEGNLDKEGLYVDDTIKAWWWKFYKNNKLSAKREYVIVCEGNYLNQAIILNEKNDTIFNKSTFFTVNKSFKKNSLILNYNLHSLFKDNKLDLVVLKDTKCEEKPDTVIALPSNRGKILLDKKYDNKNAFFFDYTLDKIDTLPKDAYNMKEHKKYFDISKI